MFPGTLYKMTGTGLASATFKTFNARSMLVIQIVFILNSVTI